MALPDPTKFGGVAVDAPSRPLPDPTKFGGAAIPATGGAATFRSNEDPSANVIGDPLANSNADTQTGGPYAERVGAAIKMTPEGKLSYLEAKFGKGNVAVRRDGEVFYRPHNSKQWVQFDEAGNSFSDIFADPAGAALEMAPGVGVGLFTANPFAVGAGAAAGNVLRQGVSEMLPGNDQMSITERVVRPVASGLLAGGLQAGTNAVSKAIELANPKNIVARNVQKAMESPEAQRGAELSARTGIKFTPGQESGSRTMLMLEGLARRSPVSADRVANEVDRPQIQQAMTYLNKVMDSVDKRGLGPIDVGQKVEGAFKNAVSKAQAARSGQWQADMAGVSKLAGNTPVAQTANVQRALQELIAENDVPGAGDATAALVGRLKALLPKTTPTNEAIPAQLTANELQRLLSVYGKAAGGTGQLFKDIDAGQQRYIAGRIFGALKADLDATVEQGGANTPVLSALKMARDNWAQNSKAIDSLGESVLGRMFNGKYNPAPEAIASKFMGMHPSEIKSAMGVIGSSDPATAQAVKRHMIEQALEAGKPSGSASQNSVTSILGGSGTRMAGNELSPAKFNSFLTKNADRYKAVLSPTEYAQMKWAYEALGRIADRAGTEGSPTHPLGQLTELAKAAFGAQPKVLASVTGQGYAMKKLANLMATEEGRMALVHISRASPQSKVYKSALATIYANLGLEDARMRETGQQMNQLPQQGQPGLGQQ